MKPPVKIVFLVLTASFSALLWAQTKTSTLSGRVTDKTSSHAVEGATVTIVGNKAKGPETTDSEGAFVIRLARGVEGGSTVRVRVEKVGYKPYEKLVPASPELPVWILLEPAGSKLPARAPKPTASTDQYSGFLEPANDPMPHNPCTRQTPDSLYVFFGTEAAYATEFPADIITINGEVKLTLYKERGGKLAISTDIFDDNDDIVAEIDKNQFTVRKEGVFRKTSDRNSLRVVMVHKKETILDIRYLNPHALRILGRFHYPGVAPDITSTADGLSYSGLHFVAGCMGGGGKGVLDIK